MEVRGDHAIDVDPGWPRGYNTGGYGARPCYWGGREKSGVATACDRFAGRGRARGPPASDLVARLLGVRWCIGRLSLSWSGDARAACPSFLLWLYM